MILKTSFVTPGDRQPSPTRYESSWYYCYFTKPWVPFWFDRRLGKKHTVFFRCCFFYNRNKFFTMIIITFHCRFVFDNIPIVKKPTVAFLTSPWLVVNTPHVPFVSFWNLVSLPFHSHSTWGFFGFAGRQTLQLLWHNMFTLSFIFLCITVPSVCKATMWSTVALASVIVPTHCSTDPPSTLARALEHCFIVLKNTIKSYMQKSPNMKLSVVHKNA